MRRNDCQCRRSERTMPQTPLLSPLLSHNPLSGNERERYTDRWLREDQLRYPQPQVEEEQFDESIPTLHQYYHKLTLDYPSIGTTLTAAINSCQFLSVETTLSMFLPGPEKRNFIQVQMIWINHSPRGHPPATMQPEFPSFLSNVYGNPSTY
jgi:hypothetical protein